MYVCAVLFIQVRNLDQLSLCIRVCMCVLFCLYRWETLISYHYASWYVCVCFSVYTGEKPWSVIIMHHGMYTCAVLSIQVRNRTAVTTVGPASLTRHTWWSTPVDTQVNARTSAPCVTPATPAKTSWWSTSANIQVCTDNIMFTFLRLLENITD